MSDCLNPNCPKPSGGCSCRAVVNPEWLALEGKPHHVLMLNEDSFRCHNFGPPPPAECRWCGKKFPRVQSYSFRGERPLCPVCWREKLVECKECNGRGAVDSGAPTPEGGFFETGCPVCDGAGRLTLEEDAAIRNPQPKTPKP